VSLAPGKPPRVMLFDVNNFGHHPNFVRHLVAYWRAHAMPGCLFVVVSPRFVEDYPNIMENGAGLEPGTVRFVAVSADEKAALKRAARTRAQHSFPAALQGRLDPNSHAWQEWTLITRYAARLNATHALLIALDTCVLAVAAGLRLPCVFAGIYDAIPYAAKTDSPPAKARRAQVLFTLARLLESLAGQAVAGAAVLGRVSPEARRVADAHGLPLFALPATTVALASASISPTRAPASFAASACWC